MLQILVWNKKKLNTQNEKKGQIILTLLVFFSFLKYEINFDL
jgi:hypothetical protein